MASGDSGSKPYNPTSKGPRVRETIFQWRTIKALISQDGATAANARAPLTVALAVNSTGDDAGSGRAPPSALAPIAPPAPPAGDCILQDVLFRNIS